MATPSIRFGLWTLLVYAALGLALEGLHGFKVGWYLDYETRRLMWTLAHAHGVLLSVLVIVFGMLLQRHAEVRWARSATACLMAATVLLPGGFLLGGIYVYDGDPGQAILLSPAGGVLLLAALGLVALKYR